MPLEADPRGAQHPFRKDIQGLRAVAVLLVLAWHARVPGITRGYVGVDAFFVISGFLITGLLIAERQSTGRLNLPQFYARRTRRLLPAAALVIACTAVFTLWLVPEIRWSAISGDALASALYVQNWRLADQAVDYFAQGAAVGPLQHYWSLAVEEQFYLVWPLLILLATPRGPVRMEVLLRRLAICVCVVFAASLAWSAYYSQVWPGPAYFVSTTRGWEFAMGGGLAVLISRRVNPMRAGTSITAGWLGLTLLVGSAFYLPERFPFPGFLALVPTVGTAAIIAGGVNAGRVGPRLLLDRRPMVFVGTISYSLYLWHWPLLVILGVRYGPLRLWQSIAIVVAAALPAYLSFRFVETPARRVKFFTPTRRGLALGVACTLVAVSSAVALGVLSSEPATISAARQAELDAIEHSLESTTSTVAIDSSALPTTTAREPTTTPGLGALSLDEPGEQEAFVQPPSVAEITPDPLRAAQDVGEHFCRQEIESSKVLDCVFGDVNSDFEIALVGDSHAAQWTSAFVTIANARGWKVAVYSKAACSYTGLRLALDEQEFKSCTDWNEKVRQLLLDSRPDVILVTGRDKPIMQDGAVVLGEPAREAFVADHIARWGELIANGSRVIALADSPLPGFFVPECVSIHLNALGSCTFEHATSIEPDGGSIKVAATVRGDVPYMDINAAICPGAICPIVVGGVLLYQDRTHLTDTYVQTLTLTIAAALDAALAA